MSKLLFRLVPWPFHRPQAFPPQTRQDHDNGPQHMEIAMAPGRLCEKVRPRRLEFGI
jgi:hypothetical protein